MDYLRTRMGWGPPLSDENPKIEPLRTGDVRGLRLPWLSRFSPVTLATHLQLYEGMSLWAPKTGEYIIGEQWRRRDDIANIVEVAARKGKPALVRALLDQLGPLGYRLVMVSDELWREGPRFYMDLGFGLVEQIVFFERELRRDAQGLFIGPSRSEFPTLQYVPLGLPDLDLVLRLDHDSFPWLWWNSRLELESYMQVPGVYVYAAEHDGEAIGYASYTMYDAWAHLDRLAVVKQYQGRKFGAAQLLNILEQMVQMGAASVALSTQADNFQSHRLYKGFGFSQSSESLSFYGKEVKPKT